MSEASLQVASVLADRYRVERQIGQGGMATVYLAGDLKLERPVALKVLRPELGAVLGKERFLAEVKITARPDHPHILTLIDSGDVDGMLYYVLPYVRRESLRDLLNREQQLSIDQTLAITKQDRVRPRRSTRCSTSRISSRCPAIFRARRSAGVTIAGMRGCIGW